MMAMDTNNLREFYLFGKMYVQNPPSTTPALSAGSYSIGLRVNKLDGKLLHQVFFKGQDDLGGYFHPTGTNQFVGCGTSSSGTANKIVNYWKINSDGQSLFSRSYKVNNPASAAAAGDSKCKGVTYDYAKGQGAILITSTVQAIKTVNTYTKDTDTGSQDAFIWLI